MISILQKKKSIKMIMKWKLQIKNNLPFNRGRHGHDRIVVGFITTYAISAYHHLSSNPGHGEPLDTSLCDKICQWLATDQWFSPGPPVSSTNKTDHHDITEILLKVPLNTIKQTTNKQTYDQWKASVFTL